MVAAMQTRVIVPLEEFPEEGLHLVGEADGALLDIDCAGIRSTGPISYELEATLYDTELVVRGHLSAPFQLRCDRCLRFFPWTLRLEDVTLSFDVKGKSALDLTEELREELLLEFPAYPKCELADLECEINDTFADFRLDKDPQPGVDSATPSGESVWDALDQFPGK